MEPAQAEEVATCAICIETFNKTIRKKTTCINCATTICAKCVKRYLAESSQQPNCMQCRVIYTEQFMDSQFSVNFRKTTLQKIRETIVIEREKQHLPQLMHRVSAYKQMLNLHTETKSIADKLSPLRKNKHRLSGILKAFTTIGKSNEDTVYMNIAEEHSKLKEEIQEYEKESMALYRRISDVVQLYENGGVKQVSAVVQCITEGCKGYLNNDYKCELCSVIVCKECREEVINGDITKHTCNSANVESVKMIQTETKPCPKCRTPIFKIEGCAQMFCTQCYTAFNWNTGLIERGRIHNPHYFQWLRTRHLHMPREMGDVPCGGLPQFTRIEQILFSLEVPVSNILYCKAILSLAHYIQDKEIRKYPVTEGRDNQMDIVSIHYLGETISEKQWGAQLFKFERQKELNTEKRLILDMILAVLIDYFNGIQLMTCSQHVEQMLQEIERLRHYYNLCIDNLCQRFQVHSFKKIKYDWSKLE